MASNNLKLSPHKTACFPQSLDLLGWTKQGKLLVPDPHRQNRLAVATLPATVEQLRSYLGGYRTYYRCQADMSMILREMEVFVAGRKSSEKLVWTNALKQKFEDSKCKIKHLDQVYLPSADDQLVITSDWCEDGISATLWATPEEDKKPKVVARFSAKLSRTMEKFYEDKELHPKTRPCDGEMSAVYVALKSPTFSSHIRASSKRTVSLVDNKPVVQAASLLKKGKFSSSRVINNLMTAISEHNIEFQHISGKLGQNFADDYYSRHPATCNGESHCKICGFIEDCTTLMVGSLSFSFTNGAIIGQVGTSNPNLVQEILSGTKPIPFSNRKAMKYLQDKDPNLLKVREYLTTSKRPTVTNTHETEIKRYLKPQNGITVSAKDGVLVSKKRDKFLHSKELVVVPEDVSMGLLYAMHLNLSHPTVFQLLKVVDTGFFILDREKKIKKIAEDCTLCLSISKLPEDIHTFKANKIPEHPGQAFTVDILRTAKKIIVVSVENFSGFVSTTIISSEKQADLLDGIIVTVTPFKSATLTSIRVDQAPGFKAIFKRPDSLTDLNMNIELGECKNKNALALVDRKIQELELEIKKIAPSKNTINIRILSRATTAVNEKIRHQGLSSKEILFSRDQFTLENLKISDEKLAAEKMNIREKENIYAAKSKSTTCTKAKSAEAQRGQLVFLKKEGSKLEKRDLYLVVDTDEVEDSVSVCKLPSVLSGNSPIQFQPHNLTYKVKQTDIFLAPNQPISALPSRPVFTAPQPYQHEYQVRVHQHQEQEGTHLQQNKSRKMKYPYDEEEEEQFDVDNYENEQENEGEVANEIEETDNNSESEVTARASSDSDNDSNASSVRQNHQHVEDQHGDILAHHNAAHHQQQGEPQWGELHQVESGASDDQEVGDDLENTLNGNDADVEDDESEAESIDWEDKQLNPAILPDLGEQIVYWDRQLNRTVQATVIRMHRTMQYRWPGWRNIKCDTTGKQASINMDLVCEQCVVWRYAEHDQDVAQGFDQIPQGDANLTIPSSYVSEHEDKDVFTRYDMDYFGNPSHEWERFEITFDRDDHHRQFQLTQYLDLDVTYNRQHQQSAQPQSRRSPWQRRWTQLRDLLHRLRQK